MSDKTTSDSSTRCGPDHLKCQCAAQSKMTGATTIAPTASPSHHVNQMRPYSGHGANPAHDKLVTPTVALIAVLAKAARTTNRARPLPRCNAERPPANRFTRYAPVSTSSVLPAAIATDVKSDPAVVSFTRSAPRKMPRHARGPKIRMAASAMPVGGQTAVALAFTNASARPS